MYFVITILIILSLLFVARGRRFSLFIKERTYLLKAFLPYMIFVHHSHFFDGDFYYVGAFVVAIFFFMSGYGLETKRIVGGAEIINNRYLVNALKKLIAPLIFPIIVFLLLRLYSVPFSVVLDEDIRKYQFILPYTWFVVTLIILYFLFYSCVAIAGKNNNKDTIYYILIITTVLCFSILGKAVGVPSWARNTTTAFLAGIFYKRNEIKITISLNRYPKLMAGIISALLIVITIYIKGDMIAHENGPLARPFLAFVWSLFIIPLYSIIPEIKNGVIRYLSSISYELYICQSIAFILLGDKHQYQPYLYLLSSFVLCTIVASMFHYLTQLVLVKK